MVGKRRVLLVGWDAADWKVISPLVDASVTGSHFSGNNPHSSLTPNRSAQRINAALLEIHRRTHKLVNARAWLPSRHRKQRGGRGESMVSERHLIPWQRSSPAPASRGEIRSRPHFHENLTGCEGWVDSRPGPAEWFAGATDSITSDRNSTMTVQVSDANSARRLSLSQKLAVASGAAAAFTGVAAPQLVEAGIVRSTTLPLSPPASGASSPLLGGVNYWDVDGDGTNDFRLFNRLNNLARLTDLGPARFVCSINATTDGFAKLNTGFNVGGALVAGYKFQSFSSSDITMTNRGAIGGDIGAQGWSIGNTGYFGFKFSNASGVHYGWGQASFTGTPTGQGFTLTEAYYESDDGDSITVGNRGITAVPEIDPASAGSVLSLVMGSLAMLERRRLRRSKAAEGDAAVSA